jgi:hypothetical protein
MVTTAEPVDLIGLVKAFLEAEGWSVAGPDADGDLAMRITGGGTEWTMVIVATTDDRLVVYSFIPDRPVGRPLADVDGVLGRINTGMVLGNFEYDVEEGTIRFKTSVGVAGVDIVDRLLAELIYPNVATVERYLPDMPIETVLRRATEAER